MIFNATGIRILLGELPFASKLSYVSTINEYQGVIIGHWFLLVLTFFQITVSNIKFIVTASQIDSHSPNQCLKKNKHDDLLYIQ